MMQLDVGPVASVREADAVIVGSGGAGLAALLPMARAGMRVDVLTRDTVTTSATAWAQGGLAAVWDDDDTVTAHVLDTLVAGAGLCDPQAVADVVAAAPGAIRDLAERGMEFDTDTTGAYDLHREGGHSARRVLHSGGDASGAEMEQTLSTAAAAWVDRFPQVSVHEHTRLIDVLTDADGAACGVRARAADGSIVDVLAPAVVLATGGMGQLWRTTSNPRIATGDGIAAAHRAGAEVRDLEFMQFHPTLMAIDDDPGDRTLLVSEAVRGEGALLLDADGRRVMQDIHPQLELAPRDVVAAAMQAHMRLHNQDHVLLDGTALGPAGWEKHFPTILSMCRSRGVDPVAVPIPVRPGAHYACGGVAAGLLGRTNVPGLFAVGETSSTGLHGANRLASNSLTEAAIAGGRCGAALVGDRLGTERTSPVERRVVPLADGAEIPTIRRLMDADVGVSRDHVGLTRAADTLHGLGSASAVTLENLDATSMVTVARLLVDSALRRTESRGCHRRCDHPRSLDHWRARIVHRRDGVSVVPLPPERIPA